MGFDDIDKKFRPKALIELECEDCQAVGDILHAAHSEREGGAMLCPTCRTKHADRLDELWAGICGG